MVSALALLTALSSPKLSASAASAKNFVRGAAMKFGVALRVGPGGGSWVELVEAGWLESIDGSGTEAGSLSIQTLPKLISLIEMGL